MLVCRPCVPLSAVLFLTCCWSDLTSSSQAIRESEEDLDPVDYSGYQVIRVHPNTQRERLSLVRDYSEATDAGVTLWTEPGTLDHSLDFMVSKKAIRSFQLRLRRRHLSFKVLINDIQRLIDEQREESDEHRRRGEERVARNRRSTSCNSDETIERDFYVSTIANQYANYTEITNWLKLVARAYPNITEIFDIGRSYQGQPLTGIRITNGRNRTKPALWIDAGIHAREWIAPATANYIINALITGRHDDLVVKELLEEFEWYIMPSINPDGYDYSHTTDRYWRRTRSRVQASRRTCFGVDANRNFDFHWQSECEFNPRCRGRVACGEVYSGSRPLSEPETIALTNFILANRNRIKLYLSLHSYSQLFLLPWGYTTEHSNDYEDLKSMSEKAATALKRIHNTNYTIGTPGEILYQASGGSFDWAKGVAGIKYSITMELRDTGSFGFLLPAQQIKPTGQETWAAVKEMVKELKKDTCWMARTTC